MTTQILIDRLMESKGSRFYGAAQLANAAEEILKSAQIQQPKGIVAQFPNERTIRFYLSEGLLPPAEESEGTASVFEYFHLVTLLVIKHLQSNGLPTKIIRSVLSANQKVEEREKLLQENVTVSFDPKDAVLARQRGEAVVAFADPQEIADILASPPGQSLRESIESELWERVEISEGIEIQISAKSGLSKSARRKLIRDIRNLVR